MPQEYSTIVYSYLSRIFAQLFSNLQLQSRLPGASQHHSCFTARSRANAFCHSRLQTRIAGASDQIGQHSRSVNSADFFRPCWSLQFFTFLCAIELSPQTGAHFAVKIKLSPESCALLVGNFPRSRPGTAETETLLRRPQEPLYQKNAGFRARERFHPWIHTLPNCYTSQVVDMMMWLTWWDMHMMTRLPLDIRP